MATDILCPSDAEICDCIVLANRYPDLPLVLSSYCTSFANSGGSLSVYWNAFNSYARLQGGFLQNWYAQRLTSSAISIEPIHGIVPSNSSVAFDRNVHVAVKPQMLEAKQCMKPFDCFLADVVFTTEMLHGSADESEEVHVDLTVMTNLLISNLMDHSDIDKVADFDVVLMIGGCVVHASHFVQQDTAMVHRHRGWDEAGGRSDFQEVKGFCLFTLTLRGHSNTPGTFLVNNIVFPEDYLLASYDVASLNKRILMSSTQIELSIENLSPRDWDIIVTSRCNSKTSWCERGYPLGFKQIRLSSDVSNLWKDVVKRDVVTGNGAWQNEAVLKQYEPGIYGISARWQTEGGTVPNIVLRAGSVL